MALINAADKYIDLETINSIVTTLPQVWHCTSACLNHPLLVQSPPSSNFRVWKRHFPRVFKIEVTGLVVFKEEQKQ